MSTASADILNQNTGDRFSFALFIAIAAHALIILGVTFTIPEPSPSASSLSVTLVTHRSDTAPEETDFLAQANQQASGTESERLMPTTTELGPFIGVGSAQFTPPSEPAGASVDTWKILTGVSEQSVTDESEIDPTVGQDTPEVIPQMDAQSLLAQLDALRQEYARQPRIGTLTSVAARESEEAAYQVMLQERIVSTGNRNYPAESLQHRLYGNVRLKLQILPDGSLETAEILESSGHLVLDRAAVDIARMAGPFPPFPENLRNKYDKIIFIRSWQFLPGGSLVTN